MNIPALLSTQERVKILRSVIFREEKLSVNQTAKALRMSNGMLSKYFNYLCKEGVMKKAGKDFRVQDNVHTKALKILLNLDALDPKLFKKYEFVKSVGLYGSMAHGTNTERSDVDLWIYVEKVKEEDLAGLTSSLQKKLGNVRPLYLTDERIAILKTDDVLFYHALTFGSIVVYGDGIEAV
jgi:predicted nucleotidyltransferase